MAMFGKCGCCKEDSSSSSSDDESIISDDVIDFPTNDPIATIDLSDIEQPAYQEYVSSSTEAINILWQ
jgi:hypothetical protein